jgi:hypothetical protein
MRRLTISFATALLSTAAFAADPPPAPDRAKMRALMEACRPDAERLCANTQPGGGRKLMCLKEHGSEVSPACRDGLAKVQEARKGNGS